MDATEKKYKGLYYDLYQSGGKQAVLDQAHKDNWQDWRWCTPCDEESPFYHDACLVCGKACEAQDQNQPDDLKETLLDIAATANGVDKTKHTPGPWKVIGLSVIAHDAEIGIAKMYHNIGQPAEANARLIAASPKLLEALYFACEQLDEWGRGENLENVQENNAEAYKICRKAIALATKPETPEPCTSGFEGSRELAADCKELGLDCGIYSLDDGLDGE